MDATDINRDKLYRKFSEYLKDKRSRNTVERDAVFNKVCSTKDTFTADMIRQQLENENFHISRASIYNTIELLINAKILVRHQFAYANVQYELKQISDEYYHVVCTNCDAVTKIKNKKLNAILAEYKIPKFTTEYYSLNIYGLCSKCKYKQIREDIKRRENEKS